MVSFKIFLPSPQSKNAGGDDTKIFKFVKNLKPYNTFIRIESEREVLYHRLREVISRLDEEDLKQVFGVDTYEELKNAIEMASDILNMETLPAFSRFDGSLMQNLDPTEMESQQREVFNKDILFVDPLFGLLKPTDYIPNYKLNVESSLDNIDMGRYWRERLKRILDRELKDKFVIDMLDEGTSNLLDYPDNVDRVKLKFEGGSSDDIEEVKGEMTRYILDLARDISRDDLMRFESSLGHKYNSQESTEDNFKFVK